MERFEKLKSRFMRDPIPIRLGGLAANLARAANFSRHDDHLHVTNVTIAESKWFIEWTAGELETGQAADLVKLQSQLALWELESRIHWDDKDWRQQFYKRSHEWSEQLLRMSGLAD